MERATIFDLDLVRKYDRPGPRYTSYPTALQFNARFGSAQFVEHVRKSNAELIPRALSLYVHVPFCTSPCFYCACNRIITRDVRQAQVYIDRLTREIEQAARLFDRDREVVQLHFGGGTPNFMSAAELSQLIHTLRRHFNCSVAPSRDFSIELDPRHAKARDIEAYAAAGLNRASLGVQDFDPEVQRAVNRIQTEEETFAVIEACRQHGFRSVNVDLIYGLPKQSLAGFERTLDRVLAIRPERLAVYGYAHMPGQFKAQRRIDAADLPPPHVKLELLALAIEKLTKAGYRYIGMDHFALPTDDLTLAQNRGDLHRNFMGYTTHADCDVLGLGMSAISHIADSFSQNARDLKSWERAIDAGTLPTCRGLSLDRDDIIRGTAIQSIMCLGELKFDALEERFDIETSEYFASEVRTLRQLERDGLLEFVDHGIRATSRGRLLLRIIAMCFDRYLPSQTTGAPLSRVV
ncbi:MAG TPA: oxygen-independent coproporphyrinogen III oxidase [Steroidobacteraceae bacterium]|nr:oxygen-independent coproporphyrinogen III oxidase [Steroidobacteraceae bacterium]